ncbi:MAG TPA: hypothetical protein VHM30_07500, partial [Gemmatimonadaceae bacterium]|nr:hypothetical protein [Gemmatimonadaceae bacterium]
MAQALVTAAAHVLLLYAHTFGIVYSAAIGIALLLDDVRRGRRRWAPYLAIASAWLLFAPWIAFLLEQARMAQPNAWFPVPSLRRFTGVMERLTSSLSYAAIVAAAALLLGRWRRREPEGRADSGVVFLVLLGTAVVLVAPVVFLESRLAKPVFVDRYVLPSALGFPLLVAPALDVIGRRLAWRRWRPALWVLFATLCIASVVRGARTDRQQRPMITAASEGAHGLPVVVESAFEFVELDQYREPGERYLYPLDWRLAVDGSSAPGSVQEYKLMALWRNAGYVGAEVADGAAILCRTPRFLVLESAGRPWFERRVRADSLWTISGTDATRDTRRLWLVSRRGPLPECTASEALPSVHPSVARAPQH